MDLLVDVWVGWWMTVAVCLRLVSTCPGTRGLYHHLCLYCFTVATGYGETKYVTKFTNKRSRPCPTSLLRLAVCP